MTRIFLPLGISVAVLVAAQLSLKAGMNVIGKVDIASAEQVFGLVGKVLTTPLVILGVVLYAVSSFFWLIALSQVDLSFAYPFVGLGYVLVVLLSAVVLGEQVSLLRWAGTFAIVAGVLLVSRS